MKRVAVLFSGRGSNLLSILKMAQYNQDIVQVVCAITDQPQALGILHAFNHQIPVLVLPDLNYSPSDVWERNLTLILKEFHVELIVLAGFMKVLHKEFCDEWKGRCINIHPSLLPKYPGLNTHKRVLASDDEWHGCTIHYVTSEVDQGPIITQVQLKILPNETEEELAQRVLDHENKILPLVVLHLCQENQFGTPLFDSQVSVKAENIMPFISNPDYFNQATDNG